MAVSEASREDAVHPAGPGVHRRLRAVGLIVAGAAVMVLGANVTVRAITGFFANAVGQAQSSMASAPGFAGTARAFLESMAAIAFGGPFAVVWGAIGFAVVVGGFALILHAISVMTDTSSAERADAEINDDREDEASFDEAAHDGPQSGQPAQTSSRTADR